MQTTLIPSISLSRGTRASAFRYLSWVRLQDIVVLQGSPLLGAVAAIGFPAAEEVRPLAILIVANALLVAHIFMLNDWAGLSADLADPNKVRDVYTARGIGQVEVGALTAGALVLSLALFAYLGVTPFVLALAIASLSALYSLPKHGWKGRPLLSSCAHLVGGVFHFLVGYALGGAIDVRGVATGCFFALIFAAGHLTQEVRDYQGDSVNGTRTNAVTFGRRPTFAASLVLFTMAHALLLLLALVGILPRALALLVALYPIQLRWSLQALSEGLTFASVVRLRARYRMLYAVIGVAMIGGLAAL
ncbi:MAG: UbiA prenyltransferase family protein [Acidobacteria bacterium]|nr:UbiA prenyltransferase family protein [Acidobacteriota bacterium]